MGAWISVITVVQFNPIKVFFFGGSNKNSYEFHSWNYQNTDLTII